MKPACGGACLRIGIIMVVLHLAVNGNEIQQEILPTTPSIISKSSTSEESLNLTGRAFEYLTGLPLCFPEVGCFRRTQVPTEFKLLQLVNVRASYPERPDQIRTRFLVFSCEERYNPTVLMHNFRPKQLSTGINFNPAHRTIILVHGYQDYYNSFEWMGDLKDTILTQSPCNLNVIAVDWKHGAWMKSHYLRAVSNSHLVAATIIRMMEHFNKQFNITNDDYSIVGHDLGAQIAGMIGKRLRNQDSQATLPKQIIAIDPINVAFIERDRLSFEDAGLVLVIHTDANGFGSFEQPMGHYNFFPNGGINQPGCHVSRYDALKILVLGTGINITGKITCSHRFGLQLITTDESRFDNYETMAYTCGTYEEFKKGKCGQCRENSQQCQPFGSWFTFWQKYQLPPYWTIPVNYYLETTERSPYSLFHYQIELITDGKFRPCHGQIHMDIIGELHRDHIIHTYLEARFRPKQTFYRLLTLRKTLGRIESIRVTLTPPEHQNILMKWFNTILWTKVNIREIRVHYMNGYDEMKRLKYSTRLLGDRRSMRLKLGRITAMIFRSKQSTNNKINEKSLLDDQDNDENDSSSFSIISSSRTIAATANNNESTAIIINE